MAHDVNTTLCIEFCFSWTSLSEFCIIQYLRKPLCSVEKLKIRSLEKCRRDLYCSSAKHLTEVLHKASLCKVLKAVVSFERLTQFLWRLFPLVYAGTDSWLHRWVQKKCCLHCSIALILSAILEALLLWTQNTSELSKQFNLMQNNAGHRSWSSFTGHCFRYLKNALIPLLNLSSQSWTYLAPCIIITILLLVQYIICLLLYNCVSDVCFENPVVF